MAKDLLVRILGDSKSLERAFAQSAAASRQFEAQTTTTLGKVDKGFSRIQKIAAGGFLGGAAATVLIPQVRAIVDAASNLNEQLSRSSVVFGSSGDEIEAWSKTTAASLGIAQDEALAAAGTFGAMFDQAGRSAEDAATLSRAVVELASDLASFNNAGVDETLTALRSGLSGEIEPLRRFQVFLTEAAVSARALADSNKTAVDQLTQGEKIMARWNLILEQTGKQQGDFARTSDGLANTQRRLTAQTRDLQANLGQLLLPALTNITAGLADASSATVNLLDGFRALAGVKIPTIIIPIKIEKQGGELGDLLGPLKDAFVRGGETMFPGLKFVNDLLKILEDPPPTPDTSGAARAFDSFYDDFLESLETDINKSTDRANQKIKSFGQRGFKPLETNELGETLQRQFDATIDALDLQFDQAEFANNTKAALATLDKTEAAIRQRISTQGRTTDLLRQLFDVERQRTTLLKEGKEAARAAAQEARDLAKEQARAAAEAMKALTQRNQFRALGLSASGEEIIPGIKNLSTRIDGALKRIGSGEIDVSSKLVDRLKLARKLIRQEGSKLTAETRDTINELIKTVTQGAQKADQQTGPLTKTIGFNTRKLLEGLALSPDAERELRQRLSGFNSAGIANAGATNRPTGGFVGPGNQPIIVNTTVTLDGQEVGRSVTRTQQKDRRRNPKAKRGPRSGI